METQPADSAGRRPKECNTLLAAGRRWLVSAIMFLGIDLLNQKK
jgi:hypothetical protein